VTRRLPLAIQCPSVDDPNRRFEERFGHEPCLGSKCALWSGRCEAADETEASYGAILGRFGMAPECPLANRCRWHIQAVRDGKPGCAVRRLGELCQHQGGDWNTFEMAPAEEWL
jgi:hypothetical protein